MQQRLSGSELCFSPSSPRTGERCELVARLMTDCSVPSCDGELTFPPRHMEPLRMGSFEWGGMSMLERPLRGQLDHYLSIADTMLVPCPKCGVVSALLPETVKSATFPAHFWLDMMLNQVLGDEIRDQLEEAG